MEPIVQFLKEKVIGKTLCTEERTETSEQYEKVTEEKIVFSNLVDWSNNLYFDFFIMSSEVTYELNHQKQRIGIQKDFNGAALFRYELVKRKSTGELTGVMRIISSTIMHEMEAVVSSLYDVRLQEGKLSWREEQMLYRDHPDGVGGFRPLAFDTANSLFVEDGKLQFEAKSTSFHIDEKTFIRNPIPPVFSDFTAREV